MAENKTAQERQRDRRKRLQESGGIALTIEIGGSFVPKLDALRGSDSRTAVATRLVEKALQRAKL